MAEAFPVRPLFTALLTGFDPATSGAGFEPGHDKWDLAYSIGELRPDIILGVWRPTDEERRGIDSWGYDRLGNDVFVLRASPRVERDRLAAAVGLMDAMRRAR